MTRAAFHCADWGTTSFRLWSVAAGGEVLAEHRSDQGMSALKSADYENVLETALSQMDEATANHNLPVVICGMAGAAQGWLEAPYADLPTDLTSLPFKALQVPTARRDVRILPGLAQRDASAPDVIRGEETLLLGAILQQTVHGTICLPGTHSKWAEVDAGTVTGFRTAMTGEVYALLAKHSTLAHFLPLTHGAMALDPVFAGAVRDAIAAPETILGMLFSVRATPLLMGRETAATMPARLSGLLIGLEIAGMKQRAGSRVTLISKGTLARNYTAALAVAGIEIDLYDADAMALAGLCHAAHALWGDTLT